MTLTNPLATGPTTIWGVVINVLNIILPLSGIFLVVLIIYSGIQYMTGAVNAEKVKGAQETMKNAVIGFVIIASAFVILRFAEKAVTGV